MANELVVLGRFNDTDIHARASDRYVDVTAMGDANGEAWSAYKRSAGAKRFLTALSESLQISQALLVIAGDGRGNHTFAERRIALHFAAWISAEFEVWVYDKIEKLLATGSVSVKPPEDVNRYWSLRLQEFFWRHQREVNRVGPGCFSMLTGSVGVMLALEDELLRHCLPIDTTDRPDGSIGSCWAGYRRSKGLTPPTETAVLELPMADGNILKKSPYVYPVTERGLFEGWLHNNYLREKLPGYLRKKYAKAFGCLPPASTADNTALKLVGKPAMLRDHERRGVIACKGFVPVGRLLPAPSQPTLPGLLEESFCGQD